MTVRGISTWHDKVHVRENERRWSGMSMKLFYYELSMRMDDGKANTSATLSCVASVPNQDSDTNVLEDSTHTLPHVC
jgi:hypothetical protein